MPAMVRPKAPGKVDHRRPLAALSLTTLQMMVLSGVIRRADFNPPLTPHRLGPRLPEPSQGVFPEESASEQGRLFRLILGRKSHQPIGGPLLTTERRDDI